MSDIVKHEPNPVSASVLEHILGTGDLSKLSTQGRVEYYTATCRSLGLNPLTRPFRFLLFNGQIQLYATKDGTDQLRSIRGITLHIVDKQMDSGLYIVTARARTKDGREDEDIGAVTLPREGESRANALMKGTTKAKRRVTLSICGLGGMPDESELDGMPGAQTFDPEDDLPVAPMRPAAATTQRAPRVAEPAAKPLPNYTGAQWEAWLTKLRSAASTLYHRTELDEMAAPTTMIGKVIAEGPDWVKHEIDAILVENYKRLPEPSTDDLPEVEIAGETKLAAG